MTAEHVGTVWVSRRLAAGHDSPVKGRQTSVTTSAGTPTYTLVFIFLFTGALFRGGLVVYFATVDGLVSFGDTDDPG